MSAALAAIPTIYQGQQFRSRLEAQWAAMFDILGFDWEYEPLDFNGYIPDFVLKFPQPLFVEIKPALAIEDLQPCLEKAKESGCPRLLALGATEFDPCPWASGPIFGYIQDGGTMGGFDAGSFLFCNQCMAATVTTVNDDPYCRRCGISSYRHSEIWQVVRFAWKEAKNRTQWKGQR